MSDDQPPTAKYRYTLQITGNTLDEIERELLMRSNEFGYETARRDEFAMVGGTYTQTLVVADGTQTPEKYATDLEAWMDARKAQRDAARELTRMWTEEGA